MTPQEAKLYDTQPDHPDLDEEGRKGLWIHTYTGNKFWAFDPRPEEIHIEDIAHALALTCRYSGHCHEFYSVAQHSWLVSNLVPLKDAAWGLLHDAAEAYITDIPRPIKHSLGIIKDIERGIEQAVAARFKLSGDMPDTVHHIDHNIVHDEAKVLFPDGGPEWVNWYEPLGLTIEPWDWKTAEQKFLERYEELFN